MSCPLGTILLREDWRRDEGVSNGIVRLIHEFAHWKQCIGGTKPDECAPSYLAANFAEQRGWLNLARVYRDYATLYGCPWEQLTS